LAEIGECINPCFCGGGGGVVFGEELNNSFGVCVSIYFSFRLSLRAGAVFLAKKFVVSLVFKGWKINAGLSLSLSFE